MSLEIVQKAKARLEKAGVDLSGDCGAFAIVKRVAWALKQSGDTTVGLLAKDSGSNCEGYAKDILCYKDGGIRDILGDAGTANVPQWPADYSDRVDPLRWREPIPIDTPVDPPVDPPTPPTDTTVTQQLVIITARLDGIEEAILRLMSVTESLTLAVAAGQQADAQQYEGIQKGLSILKENLVLVPDAVKRGAPSYSGRLLSFNVVLRPV